MTKALFYSFYYYHALHASTIVRAYRAYTITPFLWLLCVTAASIFPIELLTAMPFGSTQAICECVRWSRSQRHSDERAPGDKYIVIFIFLYIASAKDTIWLSIMSLCLYMCVCRTVIVAVIGVVYLPVVSILECSHSSGCKANRVSPFWPVRSSHFPRQ